MQIILTAEIKIICIVVDVTLDFQVTIKRDTFFARGDKMCVFFWEKIRQTAHNCQ